MRISSKILLALLLPASWLGAQRASGVKMPAPPSGNYNLENLTDINTQYLDYCAVPYGTGIMFTSARGGKRVFVCDQDLVTGRYSDLYFAKEDAEGRFFTPDMVRGSNINGKYHDGAPTFTPDGKTMIFSRNNGSGMNSKGVIDLKVYSAKLDDGNWVETEALPFNSDEFSSCHPTLTADGSTLFFSSNRPGGYGGMDIYAVKKDGENWSKPINLGPNVNSPGDEIFPFVTASNNLYYSSDGRGGMGGLDVYSVLLIGIEASQALRLPAPINSTHDDFAFTSDKSEFEGYLTSDRPGGKGQDDIYRWNFNGVRPMLATVCVVDKATGIRIEDADLRIRPADGGTWGAINDVNSPEYVVLYTEGFSVKGPISKSCDVKMPVVLGDNYYVEVSKEGYKPVRLLVTSKEMLAQPEYLVPIEMPKALNFTGVVRNRSNDSPLPGSTVRVLNKCTNRVQEYETDAYGSFRFEMDCKCEYEVLAQKTGFSKHEKLWKMGEINCEDNEPVMAMYLAPEAPAAVPNAGKELNVGTVIELENIHYDYNKFFIRKDASLDLDHVVDLMRRYPSMEIELGSHTDARGSDSYNVWLSQQRAQAAVDYIVKRGISRSRLTARGYGETQLTNHCANGVECDDLTHEENRRTEIKITRLEEEGVRY